MFEIEKNETNMDSRVGAGVRPRDHRWYQLFADFVTESVAPSSAKDDLSGETVEASCHSSADLLVGKDTQPFGKDDLSGETVEAGKDDLSGETVFPLREYPRFMVDSWRTHRVPF